MSGRRYLTLVFLANAAGFLLLGWAIEAADGGTVDWDRICGVALLMGLVAAGLARRLGAVDLEAGGRSPGAYARPTRWLLIMWALLLGTLGLSWLAVAALG